MTTRAASGVAPVSTAPAASPDARSMTAMPGRPAAPGIPAGGGLTPAPGASLRLPGEHFAAALGFLVLGMVGVVWVASPLAQGIYLSPHVAGVTHLFTLGWLTTTIFGATYQLLPVALGAPVHSERMGHASFAAFVPGVVLFALGVMRSASALRNVGIALLATGIVLLVTNVALSLPKATRRDVTWGAMGIAVAFLSLTLVLGALLAHNLSTGVLGGARLHVLATHLHVALLGWVFVMIVGMSHRLLPMFLVAHGADTRWTRRSLALLVPGVLMLAAGLASSVGVLDWLGFACVEGGVACFLIQARSFFRSRVRRRLDAGLTHAAAALGVLGVTALLAPVVLALGFGHRRLDTIYIALGVLGALAPYVMGLFYKIVPFLAWITRFRSRMGRGRVPTVAQLYSARVAFVELGLYGSGLAALVTGIAAAQPMMVRAGGALLLAAVLLFAGQMMHAAWGTPREARS
ncbi:MAG TPA: hypothetical protein VFW98_03190 [Gemmatimonadaceae bacterium]|nr:hypothetical protein [Gemmatimonadaceae bacterium]